MNDVRVLQIQLTVRRTMAIPLLRDRKRYDLYSRFRHFCNNCPRIIRCNKRSNNRADQLWLKPFFRKCDRMINTILLIQLVGSRRAAQTHCKNTPSFVVNRVYLVSINRTKSTKKRTGPKMHHPNFRRWRYSVQARSIGQFRLHRH